MYLLAGLEWSIQLIHVESVSDSSPESFLEFENEKTRSQRFACMLLQFVIIHRNTLLNHRYWNLHKLWTASLVTGNDERH